MAVWYARDNSTYNTTTNLVTVGSIGWSAMTAWAASASGITAGTLRRQTGGAAAFTASQTTTTLTVTAVSSGTIYLGMRITTTAGASGTTITALGTGTGGTGTYTCSVSQSVGSTTWAGGLLLGNQRAFIAVQSASGTTSSREQTWVLTKGAKTTDNTVTWMECTGQAAVNGDVTNTQNWTAVKNTALALGRIITDNAGTHFFIVFTAGTTGNGSEPTWSVGSVGSQTSDNTVTWTYIGTSFSSWAAPFAYLISAFGTNWAAAGDSIYVGDDHVESMSVTGITPVGTNASPNLLYSIDHTLSLPVSASGLKVGATISTPNNVTLNLATGSGASASYWYGFTFSPGSAGASLAHFQFGSISSGPVWLKFDTCTINLNNSNANSFIVAEGTTLGSYELVNTTMQFGATGQAFAQQGQIVGSWRNTPTAIAGATLPTTLFYTGSQGLLTMEGVDLTALGSGKTLVPAGTAGSMNLVLNMIDCRLGASVTIASTPVSTAGPFVDVTRCSSSATTYVQRRYRYAGTLQEETTVIRTSGASDGTTGISWNITTTANAKWLLPFESFPIAIWNGTISTNRVVTLHGIWNSASLPNNDDIWIDVAYLGASGSPQASFGTETKLTNLSSATPLTADSVSAWDSQASARQNSHAYAVGDIIKLVSNSGRIFFCTTLGTTAGSEPGGYASAVDGGSVTDGTAVFRAGMRFLLTVTLSTPQPQLVGYLKTYVKAAKVTSTFYVDPLVTLS